MYTELSLVNACLRSIGNEQVLNLEQPDTDTDMAITTVNEIHIEVLSQGWWFNMEYNWKIGPDARGYINVPGGLVGFRTARNSSGVQVVQRQGMFYDINNHTFDLTDLLENDGTIDFDFTLAVPIEDCPVVAQQYIRQRARTQYMSDLEADTNKIQTSAREEMRFLALLERQEHRNSKRNVYQHAGVRRVLGGMASVNSYAGGIIGNPLGGGDNE